MPSLKDLKNRITSVKSTRKITTAMKMVAASKLRRAQEQAEAARPYADAMARMLSVVAGAIKITRKSSPLIAGTGETDTILLVALTSDRGLCGGFNSYIVRETRKQIKAYQAAGKTVVLFCIGRKGRDLLRRDYGNLMLGSQEVGNKKIDFAVVEQVTQQILGFLADGKFDVCYLIFNRFKSVVSQIVTTEQLIPVPMPEKNDELPEQEMLFEPSEAYILEKLLPQNLAVQLYGAMLESMAGEMGARMTAMDNASRNAGDMINRLTLQYNRSRQAYITKELIEIISGAEAV